MIDSSSFTYYRVCATLAWANMSDTPINIEDTAFLSIMENQYLKHLEKFSKTVNVPINEMYMIRDCPIDDIWRIKHYQDYKRTRRTKSKSDIGPFIKHLNTVMSERFKTVLRIDEAEADDVIAMIVHLFPKEMFIIVSGDSDMLQLLHTKRVRIFQPKGWIEVQDPTHKNIQAGDPTDDIPSAKCTESLLRNMQLMDFSYIPRRIQDRIVLSLKDLELTRNTYVRSIQLGLCCCNTMLRDYDIYCARTMILRTIETKGLDELKRRALQNCRDLITMIQWNADNGIRIFRISSDIFPHKSNPKAPSYTLDFAKDLLAQAGLLARTHRQRLTFHPGQYNVVGTPTEETFQNTVRDLDWHAEVLDLMHLDQDSIMVVHGGGVYGDKKSTKERWIKNFNRLPSRVQRRLVLENCEKNFSVLDCLDISEKINIPVVFDTHHHECYQLLHKDEKMPDMEILMPRILDSWNRRHIKPKFHVSEQRSGAQIGAHSDYISKLPEYLMNINQPIDIMIEAKMKEQAIIELYKLYPEINTCAV